MSTTITITTEEKNGLEEAETFLHMIARLDASTLEQNQTEIREAALVFADELETLLERIRDHEQQE